MRTGVAELRLCNGYVPQYKEMVEISKPLIEIMVEDLGVKETIARFSDTFWFQAFACALGFEHNYTGATTVTIKALKEALSYNNNIVVLGGKGKEAVMIQQEIEMLSKEGSISNKLAEKLSTISRETARADNVLLQDSYDLYFHSIITDGRKNYAIINQGMNTKEQLVRRYHWFNPASFDDSSTRSATFKKSLNIKDKESNDVQKAITDVIKDTHPLKLEKKALILSKSLAMYAKGIKPLWISKEEKMLFEKIVSMPYYLHFPKKLNYEAIRIAHETATSFRDIALQHSMGRSTLRGLAYLASLVYGKPLTWETPQRYCYAFGTKAGKPWYVERSSMREAATYLKEIVKSSEVRKKHEKDILKRLSSLVEKTIK